MHFNCSITLQRIASNRKSISRGRKFKENSKGKRIGQGCGQGEMVLRTTDKMMLTVNKGVHVNKEQVCGK